MNRARRALLAPLALGDERPDVRRRTRIVIGLTVLVAGAVAAILALTLISNASGLLSDAADQRGQDGVQLLTIVGAEMPNLSPTTVEHELSPGGEDQLDDAIRRGQQAGVLSDLLLWNRRGTLVYSFDDALEGHTPSSLAVGLSAALRGVPVNMRENSAYDLSTQRPTGTLDAFRPLVRADGRVYGAVEIQLPLAPIRAQAARVQSEILVFTIGGAALVWILLLPFTVRAAVGIARSRNPGRTKLLKGFQHALDAGEIELAFQPQIAPADGRTVAFEALVRWRDGGKLRPPDTFLPTVEGSPLMTKLSDRVLDLACAQLACWQAAGYSARMCVNLSARDLEDEALPARIAATLARHRISPQQLLVEVTETSIARDVERTREVMTAVKELGVETSIDDFGTGHASISRLYGLPITELKIDRSFVGATDARTRSYLTGMVRFAQGLKLRVVAEGVEDADTLSYLRELGCDLVQGYHIARPLPADGATDWLSANQRFGWPQEALPHRPPVALAAA